VFDKIVDLDWRLTQHNFLVNAGGAASTLAYMGATQSSVDFVWPLTIFLVGVVASGIEQRALLRVFGNLHNDAIRRRSGFATDELTVRMACPDKGAGGKAVYLNHACGWISQIFFAIGIALGLGLYLAG
jgi:hypothetical protein